MNLLCQSAPMNTESEIQTGTVADQPEAAVATWPPCAMASLALLPTIDHKEAASVYPPTRSHSLSPSCARLRHRESGAVAVAIAPPSRAPSPSCCCSL